MNSGSTLNTMGPFERRRFQVGIICALSLEAEMIEMVFDKRPEEAFSYGKAPNDSNAYSTGTIAGRPVVLAFCPGIGSNNAAQAVSSLRSSFIEIKIVLVVGICGAVPFYQNQGRQEIMLGDCIISTGVIQFDLGRKGPSGFSYKQGLHGLGRAPLEIRSLTEKLQTRTNRSSLIAALVSSLQFLQQSYPDQALYPGREHDRLYQPEYIHTHRLLESCQNCDEKLGLCNQSCDNLGCESRFLQNRERSETDTLPMVHFGCYGSSNTVLKSAMDRDELAKNDIIAFEMEGSGVWEVCPTIIIKSACDYADSHKNKRWQRYAAATAAATTRALLQEFVTSDDHPPVDREHQSRIEGLTSAGHSNLRPGRDNDFHAIQTADVAIRHYYNSSNRLKIERLSGDKLSLDKCYINLALVEQPKQGVKESSPFSVEARLELEARNTGELVPLESLFQSRKPSNGAVLAPRRIFIRGRAGVGKTTLCKKLVHEFFNDRLGFGLFDRLLWIPLRRLRSKAEEYGWQDLIQDAHVLQGSKWNQVKELYADQFYIDSFLARTLLLFDGLDEISDRSTYDGGNKVIEFLGNVICDSPNVIVTSRPQSSSMDIGRFDLELETTGFLPDQIRAYINNCVSTPEVVADIMSFISSRPLVQGLLRIPIQLDALCSTWLSLNNANDEKIECSVSDTNVASRESISTMSTLYHSICFELCRKDIKRLEPSSQPQKLINFEVSQFLENELKLLEELAFQGVVNGIVEYSPRQLDKINSHVFRNGIRLPDSLRSVLDKLSFIRTSDIQQDQSKRNYHFLHLTFQEFFAAKHFAQCWLNDRPLHIIQLVASSKAEVMLPLKFLQLQKYNPRLTIFWRFVTGLIQIQSEGQEEADSHGKTVVTFFQTLEDEAVDLLGIVHLRFIILCLSEVAQSNQRDIQQLRLQKEHAIQDTIEGCTASGYSVGSSLIENTEFPENVWCNLLQSDAKSSYHGALRAIRYQSHISSRMLNAVCRLMGSRFDTETRRNAIEVACRVFSTGTEEMQQYIVQSFCAMSQENSEEFQRYARRIGAIDGACSRFLLTLLRDQNQDRYTREAAAHWLWRDTSLSEEHTIVLASMFRDQESSNTPLTLDLRLLIGRVLRSQWRLSHTIINDLLAVIKDKSEDLSVRVSAIRVFNNSIRSYVGQHKTPVSEEVFITLLEIIVDDRTGHPDLRREAKFVLAHESGLDKVDLYGKDEKDEDAVIGKVFLILLESFRAEMQTDKPIKSVIHTLWKQLSCVSVVVIRLVELLKTKTLSSKESITAYSIVRFHLSTQPSLLQEVTILLHTMLKDDKNSYITIKLLSTLLSLSQEFLELLIPMLRSKDLTKRKDVVSIPSSQTLLPPRIINLLVIMSKDEDYEVQFEATLILASQLSIPQEAVPTIISMLEKETIMDALKNTSVLPQEILNALFTSVRNAWSRGEKLDTDQNSNWSSSIIALLVKQPCLPPDVLVRIIAEGRFETGSNDMINRYIMSTTMLAYNAEVWRAVCNVCKRWAKLDGFYGFLLKRNVCCFELNEGLFAYWNDRMIQITDDLEITQKLVRDIHFAKKNLPLWSRNPRW